MEYKETLSIETKINNRFWVFTYDTYYPGGGMCDFVDSFPNFNDALEFARSEKPDHFEILDLQTGELKTWESEQKVF